MLTGHCAKAVKIEENKKILVCEDNGQEVFVEFDDILVAVGRTVYTDPEVARVGLNETDAKEKGIAYELTLYHQFIIPDHG